MTPELLLEHLGLFVLSLLANGLSALAGGGAGLLQLPVLLFLGLSFSVALATHENWNRPVEALDSQSVSPYQLKQPRP
ncbi:hypothetical protein [Marinobacterium rhizophilum]|uniref:hypothetical protein n=1 Tax=Marinobacterium rhizophilum TaxID=420402 RepID=UPI002729E330|nr:hypothetical protein [Marinobacterium rhizophilum]